MYYSLYVFMYTCNKYLYTKNKTEIKKKKIIKRKIGKETDERNAGLYLLKDRFMAKAK